MKKHIKKKFVNEVPIPKEIKEKYMGVNNTISQEEVNKLKITEGSIPYLMTDTTAFQAFTYKYQGQNRLIPEPDPVLVYFHLAYVNFKQIYSKRKEILKPLLNPVMGEPMINEWYEYFGLSSGFVIYLFTTLEAFINRCIPESYIYRKEDTKKTELYSKIQIEEFISFNDKMKIILPQIKAKDFFIAHPLISTHISNLKAFRDMIVHTKTSKENPSYGHIFKKALDFKYKETIEAVASFCNFYHPDGNYIVECDCSNDW